MKNEILKTTSSLQEDSSLTILVNIIVDKVNRSKSFLAMNMSAVMVRTYWTVGQHIVEFEQNGSSKAKYGSNMMTKLAKILTMRLGRDYSRPNPEQYAKVLHSLPDLSELV